MPGGADSGWTTAARRPVRQPLQTRLVSSNALNLSRPKLPSSPFELPTGYKRDTVLDRFGFVPVPVQRSQQQPAPSQLAAAPGLCHDATTHAHGDRAAAPDLSRATTVGRPKRKAEQAFGDDEDAQEVVDDADEDDIDDIDDPIFDHFDDRHAQVYSDSAMYAHQGPRREDPRAAPFDRNVDEVVDAFANLSSPSRQPEEYIAPKVSSSPSDATFRTAPSIIPETPKKQTLQDGAMQEVPSSIATERNGLLLRKTPPAAVGLRLGNLATPTSRRRALTSAAADGFFDPTSPFHNGQAAVANYTLCPSPLKALPTPPRSSPQVRPRSRLEVFCDETASPRSAGVDVGAHGADAAVLQAIDPHNVPDREDRLPMRARRSSAPVEYALAAASQSGAEAAHRPAGSRVAEATTSEHHHDANATAEIEFHVAETQAYTQLVPASSSPWRSRSQVDNSLLHDSDEIMLAPATPLMSPVAAPAAVSAPRAAPAPAQQQSQAQSQSQSQSQSLPGSVAASRQQENNTMVNSDAATASYVDLGAGAFFAQTYRSRAAKRPISRATEHDDADGGGASRSKRMRTMPPLQQVADDGDENESDDGVDDDVDEGLSLPRHHVEGARSNTQRAAGAGENSGRQTVAVATDAHNDRGASQGQSNGERESQAAGEGEGESHGEGDEVWHDSLEHSLLPPAGPWDDLATPPSPLGPTLGNTFATPSLAGSGAPFPAGQDARHQHRHQPRQQPRHGCRNDDAHGHEHEHEQADAPHRAARAARDDNAGRSGRYNLRNSLGH